MASVKIEEIVDHLSHDMRRALVDAIREVAPEANVDPYETFRAFKREVRRKCRTWESVPDQYVDAD